PTTALTAQPNPSNEGQVVVFIASVTPADGGSATGKVSFREGNATLGTADVGGNGQASFRTSALGVGPHTIIAAYEGAVRYGKSSSPPWVQTVRTSTTKTALATSLDPSGFGQPVTFTATVTGNSGTPTGTVAFQDGSVRLASAVPLTNGKASFEISTLSGGPHS